MIRMLTHATALISRITRLLLLATCSLLSISVFAEDSQDTLKKTSEKQQLIIVSSFPEKMTVVYEAAFEEKYPAVDVVLIKKKTTAGLKYIEEKAADLFWVSAPDAFEVLKKEGNLQVYRPRVKNIPKRISGYPVNESEGFYSGFAAAGYGIMWNKEYLQAHELQPPTEWIDLTRPEYQGHIALSAPSRSGTTHLTVEAILQLKGWQNGWALIKAIAANAKVITQKSSDVPKGVISGEFGIGIVIDYYGLTAKASGLPIEFSYPSATVFVPSGIAVLKKSPQPDLAKAFIDFILSAKGQQLLLHPDISRLPVSPEAYQSDSIPIDYPQPFSAKSLGSQTAFDVQKSRLRYNLVNSLFDVMITYRLDELKTAVLSLHKAEKTILLSQSRSQHIAGALVRGRDLINYLPIEELTSYDPGFTKKFRKKRKKATDVITGEQGEIEQRWDTLILKKYQQAKQTVETSL
ncbi:MAG: extracellular solute-binding protein [Thiotrichaceae bacterium]